MHGRNLCQHQEEEQIRSEEGSEPPPLCTTHSEEGSEPPPFAAPRDIFGAAPTTPPVGKAVGRRGVGAAPPCGKEVGRGGRVSPIIRRESTNAGITEGIICYFTTTNRLAYLLFHDDDILAPAT